MTEKKIAYAFKHIPIKGIDYVADRFGMPAPTLRAWANRNGVRWGDVMGYLPLDGVCRDAGYHSTSARRQLLKSGFELILKSKNGGTLTLAPIWWWQEITRGLVSTRDVRGLIPSHIVAREIGYKAVTLSWSLLTMKKEMLFDTFQPISRDDVPYLRNRAKYAREATEFCLKRLGKRPTGKPSIKPILEENNIQVRYTYGSRYYFTHADTTKLKRILSEQSELASTLTLLKNLPSRPSKAKRLFHKGRFRLYI